MHLPPLTCPWCKRKSAEIEDCKSVTGSVILAKLFNFDTLSYPLETDENAHRVVGGFNEITFVKYLAKSPYSTNAGFLFLQ